MKLVYTELVRREVTISVEDSAKSLSPDELEDTYRETVCEYVQDEGWDSEEILEGSSSLESVD